MAFWNSAAVIFSHLTGRNKNKLEFCSKEVALPLNTQIKRVFFDDLSCLEMLFLNLNDLSGKMRFVSIQHPYFLR